MALSDSERSRFAEWGIEVKQDYPGSAFLIFGPKASRFATSVALLTVCRDKTLTGHTVEEHGDVLHAILKFRVG